MAPSSTSSTRLTALTLPVRGEGLCFRPSLAVSSLSRRPTRALWPSVFHVTLRLCLSGRTSHPFQSTPEEARGHLTLQGSCRLATQAALVTESPLLVASFVVRKLLFLLWN